MKKLFYKPFTFLVFSVFLSSMAAAQSVYAPLNRDYEDIIQRYEIKYGKFADGLHSHIRPYERKGIAQLADSVSLKSNFLSTRDKFNLTYLRNDNWEWTDSAQNDSKKPILKYLYQKKSDFFQYKSDDFEVHLSPVVYFSYGKEKDTDVNPTINTRGVEVRGMIDKKIGFYAFYTENQVTFPTYVRDRIAADDAVPNEGFAKEFKTNGKDFFNARGYITFNITKHIQNQFGYDKNFIGNGYRSMILSDYSSNYFFWKLSTQVWKIKYTVVLAQLVAQNGSVGPGGNPLPKKYLAFHHLSTNFGKNLNIGLFESVISGRENGSVEVNYFNPIIFYRSLEQQNGSADNALLGMDVKYNFLRHFSLYGQLMLDEFLLKEVLSRKGWWANKQAGQIGLRYVDAFGLPNLDLQAEMNIARPFTYTHVSPYTSYTNYDQPLAHPIGANFREFVGIAKYQPINRLNLTGKLVYTKYGEDTDSTNNGKNVLLSYTTKTIVNPSDPDHGYFIGNGIKTKLFYMDLTASFQLKHNLFIDLKQVFRKISSDDVARNKTTSITSLSIRLNIAPREQVF